MKSDEQKPAYTYEEWNALSEEEQDRVFKTLPRKDQRKVWSYRKHSFGHIYKSSEVTPEMRAHMTAFRKKMVSEGKMTQEEMDRRERL